MKRFQLALIATVCCGSAIAGQKYDAALSPLVNGSDGLRPSLTAKSAQGSRIPVLIKVQGEDISYLAAMGVEVRSRIGNIVSANVPADSFGALIADSNVSYIEAERPMIGRLNVSVPLTRASLIRQGTAPNFTGATGAGVIVGVIDDGLDFRHLDFRKTDGTTRLLGLWDQRVTGAAGTPPAGFTYGGECTPAMLNDAITGNATACTQPSTGNHGTHVGGIAAGNGQQTGNAQAAYRFIGMAPNADILAANSIAGGTGGNAVVDAIAWMKARAQALGKPIVINLSLGSYFGSRDGTSNFEQALSNAGAPGVIVVAAAGNEGKDPIRAEATISQGQTQTVSFEWPNTVTQGQRIEMWYPGGNQYAVKVNGPGGCTTGFHAAGTTNTYNLACGTIEIVSTNQQASNDDRQILIQLAPAGTVANSQGAWSIEVRGDTVAQANTPFSLICGEDGGGLRFTSNTSAVTTQILTDTSSATRTIAVAAYNTNYTWTSLGGNPFTAGGAGPLGDVSDFSSRGPRRDCSNAAKCPPVPKPEITAPGSLIMSALGQDAPAPNDGTTEADGKHVAYNGTSMATPHVSGAVALMLQKNKRLSPEQVKAILFSTKQTNAFSTGLPNVAWGNGILDAQAAVLATPPLSPANPDFNADGKPDLIWTNTNSGATYIWRMNGLTLQSDSLLATIDPIWKIQGVADFNGDGHPDVIYRNTTNGNTYVWYLVNGVLQSDAFVFSLPPQWVIQGVADFNADGKPDFLMRNTTSGNAFVWYFNNASPIGDQFLFNIDPSWKVEGVADLNGDGQPDLLFRNMTSGLSFAWNTQYTAGALSLAASSPPIFGIDPIWEVVQVADWNADGKPDLLFRNKNTGLVFVWYLNGTTLTTSDFIIQIDPSWEIVPRR